MTACHKVRQSMVDTWYGYLVFGIWRVQCPGLPDIPGYFEGADTPTYTGIPKETILEIPGIPGY